MKMILINGINIPYEINNRAIIEFERSTGKNYDDSKSFEDSLKLVYCTIKAGAIRSKIEFKMTFEQFIDYADEHPEVMESLKDKEEESEEDKKKVSKTKTEQ